MAVTGLGAYLVLAEGQPVFGRLTVFAGLGTCALAFVVYDWYWPYTIWDILKKLAEAVLSLFHSK